MSQSASLPKSRVVVAASCLIIMGALLHACGGGGGGGGGSPPAPSPGPGPTSFVSTFRSPATSATGVPLRPIIFLGFNDTVNPATINTTTVSLADGLGPVPYTPTYNPCNNRIQLIPDVPLASNTVYTVSLTNGLQDDDGEGLTALTYTFTTATATDSERPTMSTFTADPNMNEETTQLMVTWPDASDGGNPVGTISYRVYVSTFAADCFNFATPTVSVGPGVLQAVVPNLTPRTAYRVVVRAVDATGNESTNTAPVDVTTFTSFLTNVYPIVASQCVACHNPPNGSAWQNNPQITMNYQTSATVYSTWVGVAPSWPAAANAGMFRVDPGDPANSFLYNKISSNTPVAGVRMPQGLPAMDAADQDVIFDWITEGALDN